MNYCHFLNWRRTNDGRVCVRRVCRHASCTAAIEPTPPSSAKLAVFFRKCIELSKGAQKDYHTRFSDLLFMICVPSIHQLAVDKIAFGWLPESSHSLFLVIQGLCLLAFASSAIAVSRSAYSLSWLTFTFGHLLADMPLLLLRHNMCNFPPPLPF